MNGGTRKGGAEIQVDQANLYREEVFTDLKVATVRRLTPVRTDGSHDESRPTVFVGQSSVLTQAGPIPVDVPLDAQTLEEVWQLFPAALNRAIEQLVAEVDELRRRQSTGIIMPPSGASKLVMP